MRTAWILWLVGGGLVVGLAPALIRKSGGVAPYLHRLVVLALPFEAYYYANFRQGIKVAGYTGFQVSPMLIIALPLLLLVVFGSKPEGRKERRVPLRFMTIGAFVLTAAMSVVNTTGKAWTFYGMYEICCVVLFAVVASHFCSTQSGLLATRRMLLWGLAFEVIVLLWQNVTGVNFNLVGKVARAEVAGFVGGWGQGRHTGTMVAPSTVATYLFVALLFSLAGLINGMDKRFRLPAWIVVGAGVLCLFLTLTRTAWAAFGLGLMVLASQRQIRRHLRPMRLAMLVLIGGCVLAVQWDLVQNRLGDQTKNDWTTRWNLNLVAFEMIKAHPWAGVGLNNATQVVREYADRAPLELNEWGTAWVFIPHNQYLLAASETGIPGLCAFLAVLVSGMRAARRAAKSEDVAVGTIGAALLASLVSLAFAIGFDFINGGQTFVLLWFIIGCAHGARQCADAVRSQGRALEHGPRVGSWMRVPAASRHSARLAHATTVHNVVGSHQVTTR